MTIVSHIWWLFLYLVSNFRFSWCLQNNKSCCFSSPIVIECPISRECMSYKVPFSWGFMCSCYNDFMEDTILRRSWIVTLQHASLWSSSVSNLVIARETCAYLSTPHYQENAGVWMASSNRKDLLSCSWIAEPPSPHNAKHNYANFFFQWEQRKIMALIYALTSSKCFVCKLGMISGTERRSVSCIHLLLPGGLREICYGLLTWELLIRIETKPCVELD